MKRAHLSPQDNNGHHGALSQKNTTTAIAASHSAACFRTLGINKGGKSNNCNSEPSYM